MLKEYLTSLRIGKAASLLRNTNLPVTEISLQCGFKEANYFSKFFRKYMNESPLDFRQKRMP
jgi:two-component system response regulator YesN